MICPKCGTEYDGKNKLCHECRGRSEHEGLPPQPAKVVEAKKEEPVKVAPKAAAKKK